MEVATTADPELEMSEGRRREIDGLRVDLELARSKYILSLRKLIDALTGKIESGVTYRSYIETPEGGIPIGYVEITAGGKRVATVSQRVLVEMHASVSAAREAKVTKNDLAEMEREVMLDEQD